jgi:hypothetical protein
MNPQKVYNNTTKDLMDSKGDETSISKLRRMIIRMIKEIKENMQKKSMRFNRIWINSK